MKKGILIGTLAIAAIGLSWMSQSFSNGAITWKAASKMYKANGSFTEWSIKNINYEAGKLEDLSLDLEVKVASVSEKNDKLVHHLQAEDYFDVANHPTANINVSGVEKTDTAYKAQFIITLKGITDTTDAYFHVLSEVPLKVAGYTHINRPKHEIGMPLKKSKSITEMVKVDFSWEM